MLEGLDSGIQFRIEQFGSWKVSLSNIWFMVNKNNLLVLWWIKQMVRKWKKNKCFGLMLLKAI